MLVSVIGLTILLSPSIAVAQSVSGVRGLGGGVAPLFGLVGPGNLYVDNQGTQGYIIILEITFNRIIFTIPRLGRHGVAP